MNREELMESIYRVAGTTVQEDVAPKLKVSQATVSRLINNEPIRISTARKVADYINRPRRDVLPACGHVPRAEDKMHDLKVFGIDPHEGSGSNELADHDGDGLQSNSDKALALERAKDFARKRLIDKNRTEEQADTVINGVEWIYDEDTRTWVGLPFEIPPTD